MRCPFFDFLGLLAWVAGWSLAALVLSAFVPTFLAWLGVAAFALWRALRRLETPRS